MERIARSIAIALCAMPAFQARAIISACESAHAHRGQLIRFHELAQLAIFSESAHPINVVPNRPGRKMPFPPQLNDRTLAVIHSFRLHVLFDEPRQKAFGIIRSLSERTNLITGLE